MARKLRELAEEAWDAADLEHFDRTDDGLRFPAAVAHAIANGVHPLKAWRDHRGLSLQALADAARLSKPCLSPIEGGQRAGTSATLKKLAAALGAPVGAIVA